MLAVSCGKKMADKSEQDYDHSYYFMASFSDEHVDHAAKYLGIL